MRIGRPRGAREVAAAFVVTALGAAASFSCSAPAVPHEPALALGEAPRVLPRLPGPGAARLDAAVALNAACERCHTEEAAEWRGSMHQRANVEPAYRRAFADEPMPFCRSCHAPEGPLFEEASASVGELGVGCVSCHVSDGVLWAAPRDDARPAPHAVHRDPAFASAASCAPCHEFAFPGADGRGPTALMQSTITEHGQSAARDETCASCHMPVAPTGKRSHAFRSTRTAESLRASVRVSAERIGPTRVRLVLQTVGVGHAFPTGDLFRRLEISAEAYGTDHMVMAASNRYLTRHFEQRPTGGKRWLGDDRLRGDPVELELELGEGARAHPVAWRVAYQRVAHPNGADAEDAAIEADIELASGELP